MATKDELHDWFQEGVGKKDFMIVVCDTFDMTDYPAYATFRDFQSKYDRYEGINMQRVEEIYDLHKLFAEQLLETRAFHFPPNSFVNHSSI